VSRNPDTGGCGCAVLLIVLFIIGMLFLKALP
jgi:hypothetical protein